ncbi:MAG: hypothetical protein P4L59_01950 [Desulfosporosinus sp.]|nr:hypothetical protein [Desulfosporosinus sp.]
MNTICIPESANPRRKSLPHLKSGKQKERLLIVVGVPFVQFHKENPALPSLGESKVVGCTYAGGKYTTKLYFLTSTK